MKSFIRRNKQVLVPLMFVVITAALCTLLVVFFMFLGQALREENSDYDEVVRNIMNQRVVLREGNIIYTSRESAYDCGSRKILFYNGFEVENIINEFKEKADTTPKLDKYCEFGTKF